MKRTGMSKAAKAADYDRMKSEYDNYANALYDMVNGRWVALPTYTVSRVRELFNPEYDGSIIEVSYSWRAMPLFMVKSQFGLNTSVRIYTEPEVAELFRVSPASTYARILHDARGKAVMAQYRPDLEVK